MANPLWADMFLYLYSSGCSISEISRRTGWSGYVVRTTLSRHPRFVDRREILSASIPLLVQLHKCGKAADKIATMTGVSPSLVRRMLTGSGKRGKIVRQTPESIARTKEMSELYDGGQTLESIGQRYDITRERVRQLLDKAGLQRRRYRAGRESVNLSMLLHDHKEVLARRMTFPDLLQKHGISYNIYRSICKAQSFPEERTEVCCYGCDVTKPHTSSFFSKNNGGKLSLLCKDCANLRQKEYQEKKRSER